MSGRRRRAARRARRGRPRPWWVLPLVGLLLLGFASLRVWPKRQPAERGAHPPDRLGADDAYSIGLRLGGDGHHLAALEYFASAARQRPDWWAARLSYASA